MTHLSRKLFLDAIRSGSNLDAALEVAEGYGEVGRGVPLDRRLFCSRVRDHAARGMSARDALRLTFQGARDELFEADKDGKIQADTVDAWSPEAREAAAVSRAAHAKSTAASSKMTPETHEEAKKAHFEAAEQHHSTNWAAAENHENAALSHGKALVNLRDKDKQKIVGFKSVAHANAAEALNSSKLALKHIDATHDAHESFKHVERSVAAKGARDPAALAAWIGRKNLGKKKFQARAAAGRK